MEECRAMVWLAVGLNIAAAAWWFVSAIRYERKANRLDRETYEKRPVISDDKMAILRPGDTCIVLCQLENMTVDQQTRLIESLTEMISNAKERGIEFIIIPEYGGQKIFVVSRNDLTEQANHGGYDNDSGSGGAPKDEQAG